MTNDTDRAALITQIRDLAVVHGKVTLASGKEADYYVDMRRVTLDGAASPLVGRVMNALVADLDFDAVGGLTLGQTRWPPPCCTPPPPRVGAWTPSWCARNPRPTACSVVLKARR